MLSCLAAELSGRAHCTNNHTLQLCIRNAREIATEPMRPFQKAKFSIGEPTHSKPTSERDIISTVKCRMEALKLYCGDLDATCRAESHRLESRNLTSYKHTRLLSRVSFGTSQHLLCRFLPLWRLQRLQHWILQK